MHKVLDIISQNIHNQNAFFVFSTSVAATTWSEYILEKGVTEAISSERFLAWDSFKSECIRSQHQNKISIPSVLRKFFAQMLIERNKKERIFKEIINPAYIKTSTSFADWISKLLPQLATWEEKMKREQITSDDEDADFLFIKNEYEAFLEHNHLFDPAWEKPPFRTEGNKYYIMYPEILQDFLEYKEILEAEPSIVLVSAEPIKQDIEVLQYTNARSELKSLALYIRNICLPLDKGGKGLSYSDIAVSVKDIENFEPYIRQEFLLYNIPTRIRSGRPLTNYNAGRLFSLIQNCFTENFSFDSVKNLILDPVFPWVDTIVAEQLIDFGIKHNCLCSYDGIDVWEQAFKNEFMEERAKDFYRALKSSVTAIANATDFYFLRKHYIEFRNIFFNMDLITEEANTIISRCIAELTTLIELEMSFPDATKCENPLAFYIEQLHSKEYVIQAKENGVNVFAYKLASCAPFNHHIIVDASQSALTVSNSALPFLSENKRTMLGITDENMSSLFVQLYTYHSVENARFSYSQRGFSGFEIPFNELTPKEVFTQSENQSSEKTEDLSDLYTTEKKLFLNNVNDLYEIHSVQKEGFLHWLQTSKTDNSACKKDFLTTLQNALKKRYIKNGKVQVSATALKQFYECPIQWLFNSVLRIKDFTLESSLLDDVFVGTFYHEVIKRVLTKIKNDKNPLHVQEDNSLPKEIEQYIIEQTSDVVAHFPASCAIVDISDLTIEIFKSQKNTYIQKLIEFFTEFSIYFSGSYISDVENEVLVENVGYDIFGKIDCVLDYPGIIKTSSDKKVQAVEFEAGKYIVDFKTGSKHSRKQCIKKDNQELKDFQLPLYTYLYEQQCLKGKIGVQGATFFSINAKKPTLIFGLLKKNNSYSPNKGEDQLHREGINASGFSFEPTMTETMRAVENFVKTIQDETLSLFTDQKKWAHYPDDTTVKFETCLSCKFRKICRLTYSISGETT